MSARKPLFLLSAWIAVCSYPAAAQAAPQEHILDAGSFAIHVNGRRVATETFSITQDAAGATAASTFRTETGDPVEERSELQVSSKGELRSYDWKQVLPNLAHATLAADGEMLVQHSQATGQASAQDHRYLLPPSTTVLDDYFFVHREVLLWRFLASICRQQSGTVECPPGQKQSFATVIPHQSVSMSVTVEFSGQEKIQLHNAEQQASRFELKSEDGDWTLWMDAGFRVVKIQIPAEQTEVLRE